MFAEMMGKCPSRDMYFNRYKCIKFLIIILELFIKMSNKVQQKKEIFSCEVLGTNSESKQVQFQFKPNSNFKELLEAFKLEAASYSKPMFLIGPEPQRNLIFGKYIDCKISKMFENKSINILKLINFNQLYEVWNEQRDQLTQLLEQSNREKEELQNEIKQLKADINKLQGKIERDSIQFGRQNQYVSRLLLSTRQSTIIASSVHHPYKPYNAAEIRIPADSLLSAPATLIQSCYQCQQYIFENRMILNCQHTYHQKCFEKVVEQIEVQIHQGQGKIKSVCCQRFINPQILDAVDRGKLLQQLIFTNQQTLLGQLNGMKRCPTEGCWFFYMHDPLGNLQTYCPVCMKDVKGV